MSIVAHRVIEDCGDGSQCVKHFSSKEAAEHYIENYDCYNGPEPEYESEEFDLFPTTLPVSFKNDWVLEPSVGGFDDL